MIPHPAVDTLAKFSSSSTEQMTCDMIRQTSPSPLPRRLLHKVILVNDDYTPHAFVVTVLKAS